jgi:hypothetical protein
MHENTPKIGSFWQRNGSGCLIRVAFVVSRGY